MPQKRKTLDELIDDFATTALQAGMARSALTRARREARDNNCFFGRTAAEVATKQKLQTLERKMWALADRIDWATAAKNAEPKTRGER